MKKDREELHATIYYVIDRTENHAKEHKKSFEEKLLNQYNIKRGVSRSIYGKSTPLILLSNAMLFVVTKTLYEITNKSELNINNWYYEIEIKEYEQFKVESQDKKDILEIGNVVKTPDGKYISTGYFYKDAAKAFGESLIGYNLESQREATFKIFGDKHYKAPNIKSDKVNEITKRILDNKFTPNTITLNIRKTKDFDADKVKYNEQTQVLSIEIDHEKIFVDIIDGAHRASAFIRVIEANLYHNGYTYVSILNYTVDEAREYIEQESHVTPLSRAQREAYKTDEYSSLTKSISAYGNKLNNEMFNQIVDNEVELVTQKKYITIELFKTALKENFTIETPRENDNIKEFLIKFFNEILGSIKEQKWNKVNSIAFEPNMFIGYLALAKMWMNEENWKEKVKRFIEKTDFRDIPKWEEVGIHISNPSVKKIKSIINYFKKEGAINV